MIIYRERFHREIGFSVSQFTPRSCSGSCSGSGSSSGSRFPDFPYAQINLYLHILVPTWDNKKAVDTQIHNLGVELLLGQTGGLKVSYEVKWETQQASYHIRFISFRCSFSSSALEARGLASFHSR